ncbi:MFS multidrug transporter-like protein [Xylogone sp. PMI_703]|nr:MFS multidrug transporter-like protein [Xylogone sp. PMI_703]
MLRESDSDVDQVDIELKGALDHENNEQNSPYTKSLRETEKVDEIPNHAAEVTTSPPVTLDRLEGQENPHNWSILKRAYAASIPALMSLVITFGSSVYSSSVPYVMQRFHVSETAALLPLTVFTIGIGLGPVIGAPISETFGRRIVYLVTFPISMFFILGAGLAQNFGTLVVCRFFAGALGSPCLAVGAGTNMDIWPTLMRGLTVGLFMVCPFLGPALGPAVGGFVSQIEGWRWAEWTILFFGLPVWLWSIPQPETYAKVLLKKKMRKMGGNTTEISPWVVLKITMTVTIVRPIHMLFSEPIVAVYSMYCGFNFAVLYCFFAAFPVVFQGIYGFSSGFTGLVFLGLALGLAIASTIFILVDRYIYLPRALKYTADGNPGILPPEQRLYSAMIGSILLPISLFWFAWTARADIHWICPILATIPFACGNLLVFCSAILYLTEIYGALNGASAVAATGILRYVLASTFPLFTVQMYHKLGIDWATSLLGFVAVALMPVSWVLFKYGRTIRLRSKYDIVRN